MHGPPSRPVGTGCWATWPEADFWPPRLALSSGAGGIPSTSQNGLEAVGPRLVQGVWPGPPLPHTPSRGMQVGGGSGGSCGVHGGLESLEACPGPPQWDGTSCFRKPCLGLQ